jgi:CRISPR-associated endonuclease/helicase Cas3
MGQGPPATPAYAHAPRDDATGDWEPLADHLAAVGAAAERFGAAFGWGAVAGLAGRLHDIGKCSAEFQAYLAGTGASGGDHSGAGALEVLKLGLGPQVGHALAAVIAGHHAGLADGGDLVERLGRGVPAYTGWRAHSGPPPSPAALAPARMLRMSPERGFTGAFLTRMLFSCLVDADSIETARFYGEGERRPFADVAALRDRLDAHLDALAGVAPPTALNALRAEVLAHARSRAELPPGLFTLTVPTGGGKTLTALSFALRHAARHGLRRVVAVIPLTSILEQTAAVYRDALGTDTEVLEHHASFDWEAAARKLAETRARDDEGGDPVARLHRAAENWDAPVIVTTAVQFFESLFAATRSRCRKLHNLANSVIVLDEAQTLPLHLLLPCVAALDELARNYGATVVLCTATQPGLRRCDGFARGFTVDDARELAPEPRRLYARLKRVSVERLPGPTEDAVIEERFAAREQMLCIVNSRRHARELFALVQDLPGAVHLTTLMCPLHRRAVLADVRAALDAKGPARVVATSLIEAGVDISFPEVWRAATGLDSIAQAAGRCNREGGPVLGRVVVFEPAGASVPRSMAALKQAMEPVLLAHPDPLTLDAVKAYFQELYRQLDRGGLDAATIDGKVWPILPHIAERERTWAFPFASVARAFRMIDEVMAPVVVPWRAHADDGEAETLLGRVASMDKPLVADLRRLQLYTVGIPRRARDEWLTLGALEPVNRALGDAVLRFADLEHYDARTGVRLDDPLYRTAEGNVM